MSEPVRSANASPPPPSEMTEDDLKTTAMGRETTRMSTTTLGGPEASGTVAGEEKRNDQAMDLPVLHFEFHWLKPTLYIIFLLVFNVVIPCLLYYLLRKFTHISQQELIGISSAALGVSSCFDAPFRLYKLVRFHKEYGPLKDAKWWHLDFFMWVYTIALFVFAFPLAIAPAIPLYQFFVFSPACLVAPVALIFLLSLIPLHYPFWLSSDPPKTLCKPALVYILEDVVSVDFGYGREWRCRVTSRYDVSTGFRSMMWYLTLYWGVMGMIYVGAAAAVTWTMSVNFAFGFVLGLFFLWAFVAGFICYFLAKRGVTMEKKLWAQHRTNDVSVNTGEKNLPRWV